MHTPSQGARAPTIPPSTGGARPALPHHPVGQRDPRRAARLQGHTARSTGSPRRCLGAPSSVCTSCLRGLISWHCVALYIIQLNTNVKYVLGNDLASACRACLAMGTSLYYFYLILSLINPVEFFQSLTWRAVLEVGLLKVQMVQHGPRS